MSAKKLPSSSRPAKPIAPPGAERLVLDGVLERHPVVLRAEPGLDLIREIAGRDDPALDAVSREVLERVREQRAVDEREHVLARPVGKRSEPRPLAADEDDRRKAHEPILGS